MSRSHESEKAIFYLRTDLGVGDLRAGGSVAHTLGVVEGFLGLGKKVVCASAAMIPLLRALPLEDFCVLKMPKVLSFIGFRLNCLASNFFFTFKTLLFLRSKKIALVYQRYSLLNFVGVLVSWRKRVPLVLEFNGSEVWIDKHWLSKGWMRVRFLIRCIENLNLHRAHSIIVVSQVLKDSLVHQGINAEKIVVNPNGVDTDRFNPAVLVDSRRSIRKKLGLEDAFVFGFIGSFSVWHGIETIAKMIPDVCAACPHAHFLLIGSGPLLQYLKDELKAADMGADAVTMTGIIAQSKAREYLAACDAFLSPTKQNSDGSRFFGSPTKLFEYMSLAKPVIASDLEQLSELLCPALHLGYLCDGCQDKVGVLVPPDNLQGFVHAACTLVKMDYRERETLGNNARKKVVEQYSWCDHTKKILRTVDGSW